VTRSLTAAVALLAAGLLLTGCGSGNANTTDAATITLLRRDMASVASAAASTNYSAADAALTVLKADALAARAGGTLSDSQLTRITAAATAVQADLAAATRTPTTTATATATATATLPLAPTPTPGKSKHKGRDGGGQGGGNGGD
jgi:hypothetical protein